jgi:hypothetical protein
MEMCCWVFVSYQQAYISQYVWVKKSVRNAALEAAMYIVEMFLGWMAYMPSFMKIGYGVQV